MMLGEEPHPTVHVPHVPPWPFFDDDIFSSLSVNSDVSAVNKAGEYSPCSLHEALLALQRYLPSNDDGDGDSELDSPVDAFAGDYFRMFEFKIRKCARGRSHDWTECPYAHPGEKARRRDPRKFHYSGTACPDFRKGGCKKGDACEFAHGVFECWLHPARYRTQPCKDGVSCRRRVCFFAHMPEQLRVLPQQSPRSTDSYDGSPLRTKTLQLFPSTESNSPPAMNSPSESPPISPMTQSMFSSLRNLQLDKMKSLPSSWNIPIGSPRFGSPRGPVIRPGFCSLPSTPTTQPPVRAGFNCFEAWDSSCCEEEPVMERVESGRDIRAKMFEKLSKENSLGKLDLAP